MKLSSVYEGFVMRHNEQVTFLKEFLSKYHSFFSFYLLGITEAIQRTESLFTQTSVTISSLTHYYLLIIAGKVPGRSLAAIEDQVEQGSKGQFNITAIAVYEEQFTKWYNEAHPFVTAVVQRATLLVEATPLTTVADAAMINPAVQDADAIYENGLQMLNEFLEGAKLYRHRNQYALAAFMLHQSVEHGLRSLLLLTTGFRTNTHNLDKLLRYCSMAVYKITEIFKGSRDTNVLFYKLQNAYIHARYKEYDITVEELFELEHQVTELRDVYIQQGKLFSSIEKHEHIIV